VTPRKKDATCWSPERDNHITLHDVLTFLVVFFVYRVFMTRTFSLSWVDLARAYC
jgi:hypothetical protein